jgi:transcriptional regulator with XRE-family HTH domain
MKRKTLKDLAEITGYSITTICRVLNGKAKDSRISDKTVQSILDKLKSLHLNSDIIAQSLRINNSYIIGPQISSPFGTLAFPCQEEADLLVIHHHVRIDKGIAVLPVAAVPVLLPQHLCQSLRRIQFSKIGIMAF